MIFHSYVNVYQVGYIEIYRHHLPSGETTKQSTATKAWLSPKGFQAIWRKTKSMLMGKSSKNEFATLKVGWYYNRIRSQLLVSIGGSRLRDLVQFQKDWQGRGLWRVLCSLTPMDPIFGAFGTLNISNRRWKKTARPIFSPKFWPRKSRSNQHLHFPASISLNTSDDLCFHAPDLMRFWFASRSHSQHYMKSQSSIDSEYGQTIPFRDYLILNQKWTSLVDIQWGITSHMNTIQCIHISICTHVKCTRESIHVVSTFIYIYTHT